MMEINERELKNVVKKVLDYYKENKNSLLRDKKSPGKLGMFVLEDGGFVIYSKIFSKPKKWYAIVCIHDDFRVDVIDQHVFDRYSQRFLHNKKLCKEKIIEKFICRGNSDGILVIEEDDTFSKRVRDGICFGESYDNDTIFYHRTFISDDMANGARKSLLDLC